MNDGLVIAGFHDESDRSGEDVSPDRYTTNADGRDSQSGDRGRTEQIRGQ
jgi:hypothetical protein